MPNVFAVPVFFICFRECLETSIIVSVLLAFLKQTLGPEHDAIVHKRLVRQVWYGVGAGILICLVICAGVIGTFYTAGRNTFDKAENIWEGAFAILASVIITLMGAALLRVSKLQDKWRVKISKVLEQKDSKLPIKGRLKRWTEKYAMFILPFVTVLREGIEAVLFIAGVGLGAPATSFPLAVICGLGAGALVGFLIYKGGNKTSLQIFLVISTCFLYLVAAGLFSKGVWNLEQNAWVKLAGEGAAEAGAGPGSYDIRKSVWHVNCCSPLENGDGGGVNVSVWLSLIANDFVSVGVSSTRSLAGRTAQRWKEGKTAPSQHAQVESIASSEERETTGKKNSGEGIMTTTAVREVE
ncbi:hypothetical protein AA0120_g6119 [Alternaria tenuissima]|nr:hypothetical protein AA0120_g6119 [Alternaria tenuissima]